MKEVQRVRTYLEKHNLDKTYWGKKIIAAADRGQFTHANKEASGNWVTCACGQVSVDIPRCGGMMPKDLHLSGLGVQFDCAVLDNKPYEAAEALVRIEERAALVAIETAKHG